MNKTLNYIGGVVVMVVSALMMFIFEPYVGEIGLTVLTVVTLIPFVVGGGIIYMTFKLRHEAKQ